MTRIVLGSSGERTPPPQDADAELAALYKQMEPEIKAGCVVAAPAELLAIEPSVPSETSPVSRDDNLSIQDVLRLGGGSIVTLDSDMALFKGSIHSPSAREAARPPETQRLEQ